MIGRPWLASTMSGALLLETASLSVVWRSVNDFATRLIFTFGYFARNACVELLDLRRLAAADLLVPDRQRDVAGLGDVDLGRVLLASSACLALSPESPPACRSR